MISKHHRISTIVDELLNYFFSLGTTSFDIKINEEETKFIIRFDCTFPPHQKERIKKLITALKSTPQDEYEACYGDLAGSICNAQEIQLIGMMID